ncbi:hypothetical protein ACJMK2_032928 [Sinanodonta woodiana]|uniref:Sushi domain-containing protein n=1 Tax=Sinanodonta woodiana TaxID=1069815 RepID=A0ABD3X794_SINWO
MNVNDNKSLWIFTFQHHMFPINRYGLHHMSFQEFVLIPDIFFTADHMVPQLSFCHKLRIFYILFLLELSASIRQGEKGRYLYKDDLGIEKYCHYCPPIAMYNTENNVLYQEQRCFTNNYPFQEKCDQEEIDRKLFPVCRSGTLPTCPLLKMSDGGHWNCTSSFAHNKTSNGYHIPVYTLCRLTCDPGFRLTGNANIYCTESRHWDLDPNTVACHKSNLGDEPDRNGRLSDETEASEPLHIGKATGRQKHKGHRKVDRSLHKKLSQILRLEKKLVNLKIDMLNKDKRQSIQNILLR